MDVKTVWEVDCVTVSFLESFHEHKCSAPAPIHSTKALSSEKYFQPTINLPIVFGLAFSFCPSSLLFYLSVRFLNTLTLYIYTHINVSLLTYPLSVSVDRVHLSLLDFFAHLLLSKIYFSLHLLTPFSFFSHIVLPRVLNPLHFYSFICIYYLSTTGDTKDSSLFKQTLSISLNCCCSLFTTCLIRFCSLHIFLSSVFEKCCVSLRSAHLCFCQQVFN